MRNNPWNAGIPMDAATVARDLYLLLAIFSASKEICLRRTDDDDQGSVYGYSIRGFELTEIGRLLVSLAATCRPPAAGSPWNVEELPYSEATPARPGTRTCASIDQSARG